MGDKGHAAHIDVGWTRIVMQDVEIGAPRTGPRARRCARHASRWSRTGAPCFRTASPSAGWRSAITTCPSWARGRQPANPADAAPARPRARPGPRRNNRRARPPPSAKRRSPCWCWTRGAWISSTAVSPNAVPGALRKRARRNRAPACPGQRRAHPDQGAGADGGRSAAARSASTAGWPCLAMTRICGQRRRALTSACSRRICRDCSPSLLAAGQMDLDMTTHVRDQQLSAQGKAKLRDLEFNNGSSLSTLPRKAILAALEDRKGEVTLTSPCRAA